MLHTQSTTMTHRLERKWINEQIKRREDEIFGQTKILLVHLNGDLIEEESIMLQEKCNEMAVALSAADISTEMKRERMIKLKKKTEMYTQQLKAQRREFNSLYAILRECKATVSRMQEKLDEVVVQRHLDNGSVDQMTIDDTDEDS